MSMNQKASYEAVQIPDELDHAVKSGLRRGMRRFFLYSVGKGIAAVLALTFLIANIPVLSASAAELPVYGVLVRFMQVGSGGSAGEPVYVSSSAADGEIILDFSRENGQRGEVPIYSVIRRDAPRCIVLHLHNVAELHMDALLEQLREQDAVAEAYELAYLDETEKGVNIMLRDDYDCALQEFDDGSMELQFFQGEQKKTSKTYVLRSVALPYGEELANLAEQFSWEGGIQVKLPDGQYCIMLGNFATREQALKAQAGILTEMGVQFEVYTLIP